jgi:hypothetical protein
MAIFRPTDFASLCGVSTAEIAIYKGRHKIMPTADNQYDDSHYMNQAFIKKQRAKAGLPEYIPGVTVVEFPLVEKKRKIKPEAPVKPVVKKKELADPEIVPPVAASYTEEQIAQVNRERLKRQHNPGLNPDQEKIEAKYNAETAVKLQNLQKLKVETRLAELKAEKMMGELIPTELVKSLFNAFAMSVISSNKEGLENFLIILSKELRLSGEQVAGLRGRIYGVLNDSMDRAVTASQKSIKSLIDEYSIKRGIGEHD